MYSAQQTAMSYIAMRRRQTCHVSHGEDNVPSMNDQKTSIARTWNNFINGKFLQSILPTNNQLSVTVVNNEILTSELLKNSSLKTEELSYPLQEKFLHDLKERYSKDYIETMLPTSIFECASEMDYLQDWHIVDDSSSIKIKNDINLIGDTYEDNSTIKSQSVHKTEKTMGDNTIDVSGLSDVDSKREVDLHKDIDVESFLMVSHSDVSAIPTDFVKENPVSRFSNICRNAWNSLARLYCKTESARMSVKRPLYLTKQHHRRKANVIAMGRGRGRAKCQLRRSGVSQTVRRKECIKPEGHEVRLENNLIDTAPNDCLLARLDSKLDSLSNMNILDPAQVRKQINSPSTSSFSKGKESTKEQSRARKKKKAKYVTKVRYIVKSSGTNDRKDEIPDAQEDLSRSWTSSADGEDDWIVFDDDEELSETREKRGATEYPINAAVIKFNDSEDSNHNFTVSDEQEVMEYPRMHVDRLIKINEYFNSEMQKDSFQHRRLASNSSETSDDFNISEISNDSNISNNSDASNNSFATEENADVDNDISFHDENSQDDSIIFTDEKELTMQTKKVNFDLTPVVHVMITWNYAYRAARRGPWEEIARDNERFKGRINSIAVVLNPILKSTHRSQVWQERFAFPE